MAFLPAAAERFRRDENALGEANCFHILGNIAFQRSDHEAARRCFDAALVLYTLVDNARGRG